MQSLNRLVLPLYKLAGHSYKLNSVRTFLTENYYCYDKWDKYFMSDVIKNVGTGISAFA